MTSEPPKPLLFPILSAIRRALHPNREHIGTLRKSVPFWFVFLVLMILAAVQILLNPFGFSDLTERYTQDISNLLITGPYFYGTAGREAVSAAIIDEETLHTLQMPWPWNYGAHARVLDALLQYRPKAVVVDFLFVDSRFDNTLQQLVDEIHRYQSAHVPIYFEGGIDLPFGEAPLRRELASTGVPILDPTTPIYSGIARQYRVVGTCLGARPRAGGTCY